MLGALDDLKLGLQGAVVQRRGHLAHAAADLLHGVIADEGARGHKAARLGAHDLRDALALKSLGNLVDKRAEGLGILEQRGDILEDDAGGGVVGDGNDLTLKVVGHGGPPVSAGPPAQRGLHKRSYSKPSRGVWFCAMENVALYEAKTVPGFSCEMKKW